MTGPLEIVSGDDAVVCDDDGFCALPQPVDAPTEPA